MNAMHHISTEEMLGELQRRLMIASVASCGCLTKTPDPSWHIESCRYARLARAGEHLDIVERLLGGVLV